MFKYSYKLSKKEFDEVKSAIANFPETLKQVNNGLVFFFFKRSSKEVEFFHLFTSKDYSYLRVKITLSSSQLTIVPIGDFTDDMNYNPKNPKSKTEEIEDMIYSIKRIFMGICRLYNKSVA